MTRRSEIKGITSEIEKLLEAKVPQVGIFWIHPKTKELVAPYGTPKEHGRDPLEMGVIDARVIHPELWDAVKNYHPDLKHLKYDQVPRGRIYFNQENNKYHVWGPAAHLADKEIQQKILSQFNLCGNDTVFEPNADYELRGINK
jgi:hypothetical protein